MEDPLPAQILDIAAVQTFQREFAAAREWEQFHTPKNLAMALAGEAGELLEIFQWLTPEQSAQVTDTEKGKKAVEHELADLLTYVIRLADVLKINLNKSLWDKLQLNEQKYPVAWPKATRGSILNSLKCDVPRAATATNFAASCLLLSVILRPAPIPPLAFRPVSPSVISRNLRADYPCAHWRTDERHLRRFRNKRLTSALRGTLASHAGPPRNGTSGTPLVRPSRGNPATSAEACPARRIHR